MHWCTPDISDRFADATVLCADWRQYGGKPAFCGPLVTVRAPADNSRVRELAHQPGQGRVMLVDGGGDRQHALLGDLIAAAAQANGWAGIIVHGCVRDVPVLAQMALGVIALGSCPRKTTRQGLGEVDVVLHVAGAQVVAGQWVFADASGIVIVSPQQAAAILADNNGDGV